MGNPHKPGTPEWQQWLNEQIAAEDARQAKRDADNKMSEDARKDAAAALEEERRRASE